MTTTLDITYNTLTSNMDGSLIKPDNIMLYVTYAMELAELTYLKGSEQKQLVIDLIHRLVTNSQLSVDNKMICLDFIESGTLSQTIDIIVDATKGRLDINKPTSIIRRIVMCCLPFLNRHTRTVG